MANKSFVVFGSLSCLIYMGVGSTQLAPQDDPMRLRMNVVLVQLNVAVTDSHGNYVTGLRPQDFSVVEDNIPQSVSTFDESRESGRGAMETAPGGPGNGPRHSGDIVASPVPALPEKALENAIPKTTEASLFILFDTSNYMYRSFVFAQDAIADFIRSMDGSSKVAFYSYSRNLLRATTLTPDPFQVINGVRSSVAGDDAALYNSLLLTVKDAAPLKGRKAIVVFSNGPDNASSVPPEDVAELAESTGTIIYILSTRQAQEDPASAAAFERVSKVSGGKAYFAKDWRQEKRAFASIREDLSHLYTLSYYPQPNPNRGWRSIKVRLVGKDLQKYHIRTRDGYRLLPGAARSSDDSPTTDSEAEPN
jgi:Ca-activated chloride channel family protein